MLPYFLRAEDNQRFANEYHGSGGPLGVSVPINPLPISEAFLRAGQQFGMAYNPDFNGARQAGVGHYQVTVREARRSSAAVAYLRPIRSRPNLVVETGQFVTRIVLERGRAVGIERLDAQSAPEIVRCEREVLLTAGGIGSPRMLMLSGVGPADHLRSVGVPPLHDLPGVGGNLQDHLDCYVIAECTGEHTYDAMLKPHRAAMAGLRYLTTKTGPVASTLFETGGFWSAGHDPDWPDIQFHLGLGSGIEAGVEKLKNAGVTLNSAFLRPRSRGTVRLASADPGMAPLIDPNYWADPFDREMSLAGLAAARDIFAREALKPFIQAERMPGPDVTRAADLIGYVHRTCKTDHHPCGTCKMGHDADAVVTPDLKVRGLEGLRVCDSAVMPRIPSSNTNAPTIMVGEKASDIIQGRTPPTWRNSRGVEERL